MWNDSNWVIQSQRLVLLFLHSQKTVNSFIAYMMNPRKQFKHKQQQQQ